MCVRVCVLTEESKRVACAGRDEKHSANGSRNRFTPTTTAAAAAAIQGLCHFLRPPFFYFFLFSYFQYVYVCIYISIVWRIMLILRVKSQIETKETSEIKEGESTYNTYSIYL